MFRPIATVDNAILEPEAAQPMHGSGKGPRDNGKQDYGRGEPTKTGNDSIPGGNVT